MKKFIYIFSILLFACCDKDEPLDPQPLSKLEVASLKKYLPLPAVSGKSYAVFVNSEGNEKSLQLNIIEETIIKKVAGQNYEAEKITISYVDPETSEYSIYILASGNYTELNKSNLYISCRLKQFVTGYSPIISISEEGDPILAKYIDNHSIAGIDFKGVFSNVPVDGYTSYGFIYYTAELGVIGFADKNGDIYALKEFKD